MDVKMNSVFDDAVEVEKTFDLMFGGEEDDDLIGVVLGEEADDFDTLDDGTTADDICNDADTESKNQPTADSEGEFDIKDGNLGNLGCPKFGVADAVEKGAPEEDDIDSEIEKSIDKIYEAMLREECEDGECPDAEIQPSVPDGNADTAFVDTDSEVDEEEVADEAALDKYLREEDGGESEEKKEEPEEKEEEPVEKKGEESSENDETAEDEAALEAFLREEDGEDEVEVNVTVSPEDDDLDAAISGEVDDDDDEEEDEEFEQCFKNSADIDIEPSVPDGNADTAFVDTDSEVDEEEAADEAALEAFLREENGGDEPAPAPDAEDESKKKEEGENIDESFAAWVERLAESAEEAIEDEIIDTVEDDGELSDAEVQDLIDSDDDSDIIDDVLDED